MAKRDRSLTEKKIEKKFKEGRGTGEGKGYKPWIRVPEIASKGVSLKSFNEKIERQHHTLSRLESNCLFLYQWADNITDIREQYLLDFDETKKIAKELGVKHPRDPKTKVEAPMSTDFLLSIQANGEKKLFARTVKYAIDLNKKRVLEKLDIEKVYWDRRNIDWGIVTEQCIDKSLIKNIEFVRKARSIDWIEGLNMDLTIQIEKLLRFEIFHDNQSITKIASKVDMGLGLPIGTSLYVFRFLVANKIWVVDMYKPITPNSLISLESINLNRFIKEDSTSELNYQE